MHFTLRVPGSTSNLGPGFDALGLALSIYNRIDVRTRPEPGVAIAVEGEGKGSLALDERNLLYRAAKHLANRAGKALPGLDVRMNNDVPMSRGLGSSSTAIVAGAVMANRLLGDPFSKSELLDVATELEGHPDNVSPCLLGGLTMSCMEDSRVACVRTLPPAGLRVVVVIPEFELKTADARNALPQTVPLKDAVFNVSRACLITAALIAGDFAQVRTGMQDRLHQPYRAHLIPGFEQVLSAALEAGALGAALSGAGPTLMAFATDRADAIGRAMAGAWQQAGVVSRFLILDIDPDGVVFE